MTAERPFYIYCHTAPNGKRYIGQTCQRLNARWSHGHGYKEQPYFSRAIAKYGWENFRHDIFCVVHSKKVADLFEQHYIAKYDTFNSEHGYNLTKGGGGCLGVPMSEEHKQRLISISTGRVVTREQRRRISETLKRGIEDGTIPITSMSKEARRKMSADRTGDGNPMYGRHHSEDTCQRIREARTGRKLSEETRRKVSESRYKSTKIKRCPVDQYDFDGNLLGHYESLKDAEEKTGFAASNIGNCARGKYKQAYGFIWRYADEAA